MRAKLVNENIDFKRGQDPKDTMDIGARKMIDEVTWSLNLMPDLYEIVGHDWDYLGHPILVAKLKDPIMNRNKSHVAVTDIPGINVQHSPNEFQAYSDIKDKIKAYVRKNESVNFERGRDPKSAMDVGILSNAQWDYEVDGFETEDYIYKGFPVRVVGKYWHDRSPYPEYAAFSAGGITNFNLNRLKWYKRKGNAKRHIQSIIDEIVWIRGLKDKTNESIEFERGRDPKDAMQIGELRLVKETPDTIKWSYKGREFIAQRVWNHGYTWVVWEYPNGQKDIFSDEERNLVVSDLSDHDRIKEEIYDFIRYRHIPFYAQYESVSFERGKDPMSSMGIGDKDVQLTKEVEKIASKMGLKRVPISVGPEAHLHDIAQWESDNGYHKAILSRNLDPMYKERPYMVTIYNGSTDDINNIAAELPEDEIGVSRYWLNALSGRPVHMSESVNFERGQNPKDAMRIGYNEDAVNFLNWVRNDYQFDKSDPENYYGYINLGGDHNAGGPAFMDEDLERGYKAFVKDWKKYLPLMKEWGLYVIDPPEYGETIIYDDPNPEYGFHAITEGIHNFERGQDPKRAMSVGHQADLKREAAKIEWDWYPDPEELENEEIIWLKKVYDLNVKVAKLQSAERYNPDDEDYEDDVYYAVSDSGEPYMDAPTFYKTPREALDWEEEYIGELEAPDESDHEIII